MVIKSESQYFFGQMAFVLIESECNFQPHFLHVSAGKPGQTSVGSSHPPPLFLLPMLEISHHTPSLVGRQCWGKTILPGAGYGLGTYRTVDIFNFSHFSWTILEKLRFLCFYIIKSMARKGYFGPKSDFRGSKIPPRGASSTWNM